MATRKTNTRTAKATAAKGAKKHTSARQSKPRATPEQREAATRAAERRAENAPGVEAEKAVQLDAALAAERNLRGMPPAQPQYQPPQG